MPRLPIGPANVAPPLRCERLEDRSLLSTSSLTSLLVDRAFVEMVSCIETPSDGVVFEEGGTAILYDESLSTFEWTEGSDGFIADEWYSEDELYYEDEWYYEEEYWDDSWHYEDEIYLEDEYYEEYCDDSWYYEDEVYFEDEYYEEYWDDSWYYEEGSYEEGWYAEDEFSDVDGMTPEEYEEVWLDWDRGEVLPAPTPGDETGTDWSWTQEDFEDGMVYTMTLTGGIALADAPPAPVVPTIIDAVDLLPLPVPTSETGAGADLVPAMPPAPTTTNPRPHPDVTAPQGDEIVEVSSEPVLEQSESDEAAAPALAPSTVSDDHLANAESLELSEDLAVG